MCLKKNNSFLCSHQQHHFFKAELYCFSVPEGHEALMILLALPEKPLSARDLRLTSMQMGVSCVSKDKALDTQTM